MFTLATGSECSSACTFILIAGVTRIVPPRARVGLHRPYFAPDAFSNLSPEQARVKYNSLVSLVKQYFTEMGGDERAFAIMMRTASTNVYYVSGKEAEEFGFSGEDPSWAEYTEAKLQALYGTERWPLIKKCFAASATNTLAGCIAIVDKRFRN